MQGVRTLYESTAGTHQQDPMASLNLSTRPSKPHNLTAGITYGLMPGIESLPCLLLLTERSTHSNVYRIETWKGIATGWKVQGNCQYLTAERAVDLGETLKRMFPERIFRIGNDRQFSAI
jgi:hypothetical protein